MRAGMGFRSDFRATQPSSPKLCPSSLSLLLHFLATEVPQPTCALSTLVFSQHLNSSVPPTVFHSLTSIPYNHRQGRQEPLAHKPKDGPTESFHVVIRLTLATSAMQIIIRAISLCASTNLQKKKKKISEGA